MANKSKTAKYDSNWYRTAENKIKAITKALETAKGKQIEFLKGRIEFWQSGVHKQKQH